MPERIGTSNKSTSALVRLLERTQALGLGELALVQAQADWTAALDQADEASGTITRVTNA